MEVPPDDNTFTIKHFSRNLVNVEEVDRTKTEENSSHKRRKFGVIRRE